MIIPIVTYGNPVLRRECEEVTPDYPELDVLIENMWDTLKAAEGSGLAAPQVKYPLQLFIVNSLDSYQYMSTANRETYFDGDTGIKETFLNARITEYGTEKYWDDEEGCLSIPGLSEPVRRSWRVQIEYQDREFNPCIRTYSGLTARVIQHEYDHTLGKLYIDYLGGLRKQLIKNKLQRILNKKVHPKYRIQ